MREGRIGFVGLGNIGAPAAVNLLRAGYDVVGLDIRRNETFIAAGGTMVADAPALIAAMPDAGAIVQSLPNAAAMEATISALLDRPVPGLSLVDISSYALADKRAAAERLEGAGMIMLDCEISGLPPHVAKREATIFKAGDRDTVDRLAPLFDALAERHFYLGAFGAATQMKLIANMMVCVHNLMAAEALALGERLGIDPLQMIDALRSSAAGSATFAAKAPLMVTRDFSQGAGPFRHMFGYLQRVDALAREGGSATPLLDATSRVYELAQRQERHDQDIAAIIEVVETLRVGEAAHAD